jgi:hypothetical protein
MSSSYLFPSGFPTKIWYPFNIFPMHAICPVHLLLCDLITLIICGEMHKLWNSSLCSLSSLPTLPPSQVQIFSLYPVLIYPQSILPLVLTVFTHEVHKIAFESHFTNKMSIAFVIPKKTTNKLRTEELPIHMQQLIYHYIHQSSHWNNRDDQHHFLVLN